MTSPTTLSDRRAFLSFLAASPILACAGFSSRWVEEVLAAPTPEQDAVVIKSVKEALTVFGFDPAARAKLSTAHYTFITDCSFNNQTLLANPAGFAKYEIRLRRLTGITKVDQSVRIFGTNWDSPIFFSPVGRMNAYYPNGAVTVARAARSTSTLQILAGSAAIVVDPKGIDDVVAARGEPVWVAGLGDTLTEPLLRRIEATGCPVIVWTCARSEEHTSELQSPDHLVCRLLLEK